ncbi:hypothetical protein CSA80_02245 [Candidatus Saccharibacteria bacterium]|nr:MAG: hypothetical protein CR973_02660 [Candidatus Saccharibacteria bacterium]PID99558.1 MAG: hypothetical protein CSA80_02245 [Candidatus Saccharibacteria bacterium]
MGAGRPEEGKGERMARWYRNVNALGALACFAAGAVLTAPLAVAANTLGVLNLAQAAGGEVIRQSAQKRHKKS